MSESEDYESENEMGVEAPNLQNEQTQTQTVGGSTTSIIECPSLLLKAFARGPYNYKKPLLQFVTNKDVGKKIVGGGRTWRCHFCETEFKGSYTRVESHLTGKLGTGVRVCKNMNRFQFDETTRLVHEAALRAMGIPKSSQASTAAHSSSSSAQQTIASSSLPSPSSTLPPTKKRGNIADALNIQAKEKADDAVAVLFYAHGLPFHLARSPYFKDAFQKARDAGPSYVLPGETRLRTSLLEKQYAKCNLTMQEMKRTWLETGCSIVMDGWTDIRQHPLINIIVTCSDGPFFLRAVDCSGKKKDAEFQFLLLKNAIEEVGPSNVVQVITDAAPVCQRAGKLIEGTFRHIFWTPCCVHALNNALRDIGKIAWVKNVVAEVRDLQMFICNRHISMALFRSFSKKEFIKPAETRYATYFLLLERMLEVQDALQGMVVTQEWKKWPDSQTDEGKGHRDKVLDETWWEEIRYIVSFLAPVVDVIRYADTDSPNLGEIYETFDSMLEKMKKIITAKDLSFYEGHIGPIILKRWNKMNTPIHMAAYALNPKWYAPRDGKKTPNDDHEVKDGFRKFVNKLYTAEESAIIRTEFMRFVRLRGPRFNTPECKNDRAGMAQSDPIGWWDLYGDDAPHLKPLAIKLLSQVGSSSAAERNWSTYGFIHSMRRNRLTPRRAEKLVAVHSSLRLSERVKPEYRASPVARWDVDPVEAASLEVDDDVETFVGFPMEELQLDDEGSSSDSFVEEHDDHDIDYDHDHDLAI